MSFVKLKILILTQIFSEIHVSPGDEMVEVDKGGTDRKKKKGGEVNEPAGKISWPHILGEVARLAYLAAHEERTCVYVRACAVAKGSLLRPYRNENRASRKTARYACLKCSREAH